MQENKIPSGLKLILSIAGITIGVYLIVKLIEYIISDPKEKKPRIFISHSWSYNKDFKNLLKKFKYYGLDFYNHSIPKEKPLEAESNKELIHGIRKKMIYCSKFIVIAGPYVKNSEIIKKEIEIAKELKKEIIAVKPWGQISLPSYIAQNADIIIGSHGPTIISKIKNSKVN